MLEYIRGWILDFIAYYNSILKNGDAALEEFIIRPDTWRAVAAERAESVINIVTAVLAGLFSLRFYKSFAVEKIKEYRVTGGDPRYYKIGLSALGGTSGGMAFLGVVIIVLTSAAASVSAQLTYYL